MLSFLPLAFLGLLRALPGRSSGVEHWSWRWDPLLALALGLGGMALSGFFLSPHYLMFGTLTASDFGQYCTSLSAWREGDLSFWAIQRSVAAGALAGMFSSSLGIIDALVLAAHLSVALLFSALYLWGRALGDRLSGVFSAILGLSVPFVVILSRTVTFYPEVLAVSVLSSAGAALCWRYRSFPAFFMGGLGIALVLLVDVRGLLWALPALGICGLASLGTPWRFLPLRLGFLALPIWVSYWLGRFAFRPTTPSLERQVAWYLADTLRFAGVASNDPILQGKAYPATDFLWGYTSPLRIVDTLNTLISLQKKLPPMGQSVDGQVVWATQVLPWVGIGIPCLILCLWSLHKHPRLLIGLLSFFPYVFSLQGAIQGMTQIRYLSNSFVALPIILGLGLATLGRGAIILPAHAPTSQSWQRVGLGSGFLLLLVLGILPNWLSPFASWREPLRAEEEPAHTLHVLQGGDDRHTDPLCVYALRKDFEAGIGPGSLWYPSSKAGE